MKKFIIAAVMLAVSATGAFAKDTSYDAKAENHLALNFKNAQNISWTTKSNSLIEADFTWEGNRLKAFYNADGEYVGVCRNIDLNKLPLRAIQTINAKYAGYLPSEIIEYDEAENGLHYYVSLAKENKILILKISSEGEASVFKK
jgi:hypothetical protein